MTPVDERSRVPPNAWHAEESQMSYVLQIEADARCCAAYVRAAIACACSAAGYQDGEDSCGTTPRR